MPGTCNCDRCKKYPRIDIITGRTDDMVKVKGVNMFPAQFDEVLSAVPDASSEYQVMIDHLEGKDILTLFFETPAPKERWQDIESQVAEKFREVVGPTINPKAVKVGDLPRSEKKTSRIFDNRY